MTSRKFNGAFLGLLFVALIGGTPAAKAKSNETTDGTKFGSKSTEIKAKGEFTVVLSFPAGKEVTATTDGEKQTDVHLFIYDAEKKEIGKDTSPGPKCEVKFTPAAAGKYKLLVRNLGPGANKVTLGVQVAE